MTEIWALYRGHTVGEARLVAVTVNPEIVGRFAKELADEVRCPETESASAAPEKLRAVTGGRK